MHTPDDDDSPPGMMDPGQNEKKVNLFMSVYTMSNFGIALLITLKGVYWVIAS